jgi:hypothetical protein
VTKLQCVCDGVRANRGTVRVGSCAATDMPGTQSSVTGP